MCVAGRVQFQIPRMLPNTAGIWYKPEGTMAETNSNKQNEGNSSNKPAYNKILIRLMKNLDKLSIRIVSIHLANNYKKIIQW